jgi:2'-hydroxyisoflavone reductase
MGGTRCVGRAFVAQAVREGHDVAVFHRSVSEPEDFPRVEHRHGDRDGQLGLLRGRSWDAVLDTCGRSRPSLPPLAQTVTDTLAWDQERGQPDLRTGLSKEKERELLATWHSRR